MQLNKFHLVSQSYVWCTPPPTPPWADTPTTESAPRHLFSAVEKVAKIDVLSAHYGVWRAVNLAETASKLETKW